MSTFATEVGLLEQQFINPRCRAVKIRRFRVRQIIVPMCLFSVLVVQLWVRITFIEKGYQLEELRKAALKNDSQLRQNRLEYALLTSPTKLIELAERKLKMIELTPQRMRKIKIVK